MRILAILTSALLISGCANHDAEPAKLTSNILLRASSSWDGTPYLRYPDDKPELSLLRIQIPATTSLDWHCHLAPNMGYLVKGEIEVETLDGKRTRVRAGESLAEIVNRVHRGHTSGQPAELLMFYAGAAGIAPATPASECPVESVSNDIHPGPLIDLIQARLSIAQAVALHKWDKAQPVEDSAREQQVLASVRQAASRHGLDPERAAAFFADQIEANKLVQYALLERWHAANSAPDVPRQNLQSEIRPLLDRLQEQMLEILAQFEPGSCARNIAQNLDARDVDSLTRRALTRATGQLCDKS